MILYYFPVCQISLKIKILILLLQIDCKFISLNTRADYKKLFAEHPFFYPPVFMDKDSILYDGPVIRRYLLEKYNSKILKSNNWQQETMEFFIDVQIREEVWKKIVYERTLKILAEGATSIDFNRIKEGISKSKYYLSFFENLLQKNSWLNSNEFSFLDVSLFAFLMTLDYCGQLPWYQFPEIKKWYGKIKSKQELKNLFKERIPFLDPSPNYSKIDF